MPIKGLTTDVRPSFPSLGTLRKGEARTKEDMARNRPGKDLPGTFRFVTDDPRIMDAFVAAYGERPDSLPIFLPNKAIEDNWEAWREAWVAGSLKHRCDGETCVIWQGPDGAYHREPVECPGDCKPVGRLRLLLPELLKAGHVGYVTFVTTSKHDILTIQACLEDAAAKANGRGLQGIEFRLYRAQADVSMYDDKLGKRVRRKKWLVKLTPSVRWVQAQLAGAERLALNEPERPEPDEEDAIDGEVIEDDSVEGDGVEDDGSEWEVEDDPFEEEGPQAPDPQPAPPGKIDIYAVREQLRSAARDLNDRYPTYHLSDAQRGLIRHLIALCTNGEGDAADDDRHRLLAFLWGKRSSNDLDYGEGKATIHALIDRERSDAATKTYAVNDDAPALVIAALAEQQRLDGQGDLFEEGDDALGIF